MGGIKELENSLKEYLGDSKRLEYSKNSKDSNIKSKFLKVSNAKSSLDSKDSNLVS